MVVLTAGPPEGIRTWGLVLTMFSWLEGKIENLAHPNHQHSLLFNFVLQKIDLVIQRKSNIMLTRSSKQLRRWIFMILLALHVFRLRRTTSKLVVTIKIPIKNWVFCWSSKTIFCWVHWARYLFSNSIHINSILIKHNPSLFC